MENIKKALYDLAMAVESNSNVKNIKVTVTLEKPKSARQSLEANNFRATGRGHPLPASILYHIKNTKSTYYGGKL